MTIEEGAFIDCPSLKSITIPKSVNIIGEMAFGYVTTEDGIKAVKDFTIYGYQGSTAQEYADKNGFTFLSVEKETDPLKV